MINPYEALSWLPTPPVDFLDRLRVATSGSELRELAKYNLDDGQLRKLSGKLQDFQNQSLDLTPLSPLQIGVISNGTTKLIIPALIAGALRHGISLKVIEAEFNQIANEVFSEHSSFFGKQLSAILVAIDYRGFPIASTPGDLISARRGIEESFDYIKGIVQALRRHSPTQIILQNIAPPPEAIFGSFERCLPGTPSWIFARLNLEFDKLLSDDVFILDMVALASNVGLANWHDPTLWNVAKLPFNPRYTPVYTDAIARILAARLGKSRRCLILDLDNTLWGGIIGDDGMEGILIGNGDPISEAHLHIQQIALELRERGIVLAISSKNEDAVARQPFKEHPDMLLRENHIAVFQANWSDKASNIKAISEELSLGLESMVFLDDNPAERLQVRNELPEVAVPELPDDPALYIRTLIAAGYFEVVTYSEEDQRRASFYQDNAKRANILRQSSSMDSYLMSLNMEITISSFDILGRQRIAQLISKSNQFNLTTKRYSELDIKGFEESANFFTRQIRLKDLLGDNGMISVIICKKNKSFWEIDTWLMSCRVLGRRVEEAALHDIVKNAQKDGANTILGYYSPTARNMIVRDHYKKLGFSKISEELEREVWELKIADYQFLEIPMTFKNL